ncbi:hypothetical protein WJX74_008701 [Apatococcus lobatus]|uniref:Uncharacterized protein n=1 Tax=Apatococcus lobatus TaxID=904363 RepID=A0AAW1QTD7_9CHLO
MCSRSSKGLLSKNRVQRRLAGVRVETLQKGESMQSAGKAHAGHKRVLPLGENASSSKSAGSLPAESSPSTCSNLPEDGACQLAGGFGSPALGHEMPERPSKIPRSKQPIGDEGASSSRAGRAHNQAQDTDNFATATKTPIPQLALTPVVRAIFGQGSGLAQSADLAKLQARSYEDFYIALHNAMSSPLAGPGFGTDPVASQPPRVIILGTATSGADTVMERICQCRLWLDKGQPAANTATIVVHMKQCSPGISASDRVSLGNLEEHINGKEDIASAVARLLSEAHGTGSNAAARVHVHISQPDLSPMEVVGLCKGMSSAQATEEAVRPFLDVEPAIIMSVQPLGIAASTAKAQIGALSRVMGCSQHLRVFTMTEVVQACVVHARLLRHCASGSTAEGWFGKTVFMHFSLGKSFTEADDQEDELFRQMDMLSTSTADMRLPADQTGLKSLQLQLHNMLAEGCISPLLYQLSKLQQVQVSCEDLRDELTMQLSKLTEAAHDALLDLGEQPAAIPLMDIVEDISQHVQLDQLLQDIITAPIPVSHPAATEGMPAKSHHQGRQLHVSGQAEFASLPIPETECTPFPASAPAQGSASVDSRPRLLHDDHQAHSIIRSSIQDWLDGLGYMKFVEASVKSAMERSQAASELSRYAELENALVAGLSDALQTAEVAASIKAAMQPHLASLPSNNEIAQAYNAGYIPNDVSSEVNRLLAIEVKRAFDERSALLPEGFELEEPPEAQAMRKAIEQQLQDIETIKDILKEAGIIQAAQDSNLQLQAFMSQDLPWVRVTNLHQFCRSSGQQSWRMHTRNAAYTFSRNPLGRNIKQTLIVGHDIEAKVNREKMLLDSSQTSAVFEACQGGVFALCFGSADAFEQFAREFEAAEFLNATGVPRDDLRLMAPETRLCFWEEEADADFICE